MTISTTIADCKQCFPAAWTVRSFVHHLYKLYTAPTESGFFLKKIRIYLRTCLAQCPGKHHDIRTSVVSHKLLSCQETFYRMVLYFRTRVQTVPHAISTLPVCDVMSLSFPDSFRTLVHHRNVLTIYRNKTL